LQALFEVVAPVFLVIAAGYAAVRLGWFGAQAVDGLMSFAQRFAVPALLFLALARLDLRHGIDLMMMLAFYAGASVSFFAGMLGARLLFGRDWQDSVAIGFAALFSNSVLLGLPITERAYGPEALAGNYAIIAIHTPFCYLLGITTMEIVRSEGRPILRTMRTIMVSMIRNPLVIGMLGGVATNLSGLPLPGVADDALRLLVAAALPAALFALGGVLQRYRIEGNLLLIGWVCALSLVVHPAVTFTLASLGGVDTAGMRSAVLNAAMAPGVNAYLFAELYGRARRTAASAVLIGTTTLMVTAALWIILLP